MDQPAPRKILLTADTLGGVWDYALELAQSLAPQRVEIALATMGAPLSKDQRRAAAELPNVELFESTFALEWMDDPWPDVARCGDWLLNLAADFEPDVIHLNGYAHGALPWDAPTLIVAHSCVASWWKMVKRAKAPPRYNEYRRRVKRGLAAADAVVAPTAAMLAALVENYGPIGHARVISNARDPGRFFAAAKQPRIMAAGRFWDEGKNMAALNAAAPHVPWPIRVAGDCVHPNGSRASFGDLHCLGRLAPGQIVAELAASAIYALPARYEPFGLSALEAGLSKCALVLGDIPSLREVWGDAAMFVAPEDVAALTAVLNELIAHPARRRQLGRMARERALKFAPDKMAREYLAAYQTCLAREEVEVAA